MITEFIKMWVWLLCFTVILIFELILVLNMVMVIFVVMLFFYNVTMVFLVITISMIVIIFGYLMIILMIILMFDFFMLSLISMSIMMLVEIFLMAFRLLCFNSSLNYLTWSFLVSFFVRMMIDRVFIILMIMIRTILLLLDVKGMVCFSVFMILILYDSLLLLAFISVFRLSQLYWVVLSQLFCK